MKLLRAAFFVVLCEAAGVVGALFTVQAIPGWYANLTKPEFAPPNWIFGPVWTTLYALMGIAAYLVWEKRNVRGAKTALGFFVLQLALNAVWSPVFFGLHAIGPAFVIIISMLLAILGTVTAFWKVSRPAAFLLLPYLAWVAFASYLNFSLFALN